MTGERERGCGLERDESEEAFEGLGGQADCGRWRHGGVSAGHWTKFGASSGPWVSCWIVLGLLVSLRRRR